MRTAARAVAAGVEEVCAQTGWDRVHVVGHSLGGLAARYYVQRLGGSERVHTLGTPHTGTLTARMLPRGYPLAHQLRPGSDLLTELASPAPECRTRVLAFWTDLDHLVVPSRNATLSHPDLVTENVLVRGAGHTSLPVDRRVVRRICSTLAALQPSDDLLEMRSA